MEDAEVCPGTWMSLRDLPEGAEPPAGIEIREVTDAVGASSLLELMAQRMYERIGFRIEAPFAIFTPPNMLHL